MWPGLPEVAAGCWWVGGVAVPPPALPSHWPPAAAVSCLVVWRAVLGPEGQVHLCKEAADGRPDESAAVTTVVCCAGSGSRAVPGAVPGRGRPASARPPQAAPVQSLNPVLAPEESQALRVGTDNDARPASPTTCRAASGSHRTSPHCVPGGPHGWFRGFLHRWLGPRKITRCCWRLRSGSDGLIRAPAQEWREPGQVMRMSSPAE